MKNLNEMKMQQKDFIAHLRVLTEKYVSTLEKSKIQTILLSGSVARGDYFLGKFGGYVDLIVMTKEPDFDKNSVFGKDIEPEIPYHCVETFIDGEKVGFEIDIRPFVSGKFFFMAALYAFSSLILGILCVIAGQNCIYSMT